MQYYIQEKVKKFLTSGYLLYRNQDFFHLPPVDLSPAEHQALYDICRQVMENKGFQSYFPISTSLAHIQLFVEMLHLQQISYIHLYLPCGRLVRDELAEAEGRRVERFGYLRYLEQGEVHLQRSGQQIDLRAQRAVRRPHPLEVVS